MPTFQELLTQLSSEYERVESALADALADLRARSVKDVPTSTVASRTFFGDRPNPGVGWQDEHTTVGARGHSSLAFKGSQDPMDHEEKEEEEGEEEYRELCERGRTWSWEPTPLTVEKRPTMEPVAEEGPGITVGPVVAANVRSRGASGPPALAPILVVHAPKDNSVADHSHCRHPGERSSSRLLPVPPVVMETEGKFVRQETTWSTYTAEKEARMRSRSNEKVTGPQEEMTNWASFALRRSRQGPIPVIRRSIRDFRDAGTKWVINPEQSAALERWDQITIVALAFVAIVTPVQVSMLETKLDVMFFVDCVIDFVCFCDMVLQFFLMYPIQTNGVSSFEYRHSKIIARYLKTWFAIDFLSIVPFDIFVVLSNSEGLNQVKIVKASRLLRLLKLIRVLRASRVFNRFESRMSITYGRLALLKFFVILSVITHWLANLWALTLVIVDESEGLPRWVDTLTDLEANIEVKTKDSPAKLYIACLYFTSYTITSVGYGDIGPKNISERVILTFMIIVSGISWAVVLGQVCGIVANLDKDEQVFRSTMDELNTMMQDRGIPGSMRARLRSFFLSNKTAYKRARQVNIMSAMSRGLRAELCWEINRLWLDKVSFLRPVLLEDQRHENTGIIRSLRPFVLDMSLIMQQVVCAQGEVFGVPHTMYILNLGLVGRVNRLFRSGSVWGCDFVLSDWQLLEPVDSYAFTYIELTTLTRQDFFDLVTRHARGFPEIYRTLRRYCCWLAFQRALLLEARRRQGSTRGDSKDTVAPMPSVSNATPFPQPPAPP